MAGRDGHTACPEAVVRISRDTLTWEGCSGPAVGSGVRPGRRDGGLGEIELGVWINYVDGEQAERRFVRKFLFNTFVGTAVRAEAEWTGPCINAMSVFPDACGVESGFATWVND